MLSSAGSRLKSLMDILHFAMFDLGGLFQCEFLDYVIVAYCTLENMNNRDMKITDLWSNSHSSEQIHLLFM